MKNQEVWDDYRDYTGDITKHARYLGFAGVAICWFFRSPDAVIFPSLILGSLGAFVAFFLLDLLQYYVGALRLRIWMYREEAMREGRGEKLDADEYWLPKNHDKPMFILFHAKLVPLVVGFLLIGGELVCQGVSGASPTP